MRIPTLQCLCYSLWKANFTLLSTAQQNITQINSQFWGGWNMFNTNLMGYFLFPMLPWRGRRQFLSSCWPAYHHYQADRPVNTQELKRTSMYVKHILQCNLQAKPLSLTGSLLAFGLSLHFQVSVQTVAPGWSAVSLWPTLPAFPVMGGEALWHDQPLLQHLAGATALWLFQTQSAKLAGSRRVLAGCCQKVRNLWLVPLLALLLQEAPYCAQEPAPGVVGLVHVPKVERRS